MKIAHLEGWVLKRRSLVSERQLSNRRDQGSDSAAAGHSKVHRSGAKQSETVGIALMAGMFALWLSLTILGVIGLNSSGRELLSSLWTRVFVASELALMLCIIGLPLFLPWFAAFLAAYFFIPKKCILRKRWLCALSGSLIGVLALWIDGLVCSLVTPGAAFSPNLPLLMSASIPAAVLGGVICFTAAISEIPAD